MENKTKKDLLREMNSIANEILGRKPKKKKSVVNEDDKQQKQI